MRALLVPLAATALAICGGCDGVKVWQHPELAACRAFVAGGLRSPATYKEMSTNFSNGKDGDGRALKGVTIIYDSANAYGTPVRGSQLCDFPIGADGKFVSEPSVSVAIASADRALGGQNGGSFCCRPTPILKPGDPRATEQMPLMDNGVAH